MTGAKTDLVILAGGAATRLGSVCADMPKSLLPVAGVPFLTYPLDQVARSVDLHRVIICARQGASYQFRQNTSIFGHAIHVIEESEPLGTGGAILSAYARIPLSDPFIVMNGDVLFRMDCQSLIASAALYGAALTAIRVSDAGRFGAVQLAQGRVKSFQEKTEKRESGLISAGLYAFTHGVIRSFPTMACSFEHDMAPLLAAEGKLGAVLAAGPFIDIGTPESLAAADAFVNAAAQF
jgi:NDP-sugar pyrophosphorylase family protein